MIFFCFLDQKSLSGSRTDVWIALQQILSQNSSASGLSLLTAIRSPTYTNPYEQKRYIFPCSCTFVCAHISLCLWLILNYPYITLNCLNPCAYCIDQETTCILSDSFCKAVSDDNIRSTSTPFKVRPLCCHALTWENRRVIDMIFATSLQKILRTFFVPYRCLLIPTEAKARRTI